MSISFFFYYNYIIIFIYYYFSFFHPSSIIITSRKYIMKSSLHASRWTTLIAASPGCTNRPKSPRQRLRCPVFEMASTPNVSRATPMVTNEVLELARQTLTRSYGTRSTPTKVNILNIWKALGQLTFEKLLECADKYEATFDEGNLLTRRIGGQEVKDVIPGVHVPTLGNWYGCVAMHLLVYLKQLLCLGKRRSLNCNL